METMIQGSDTAVGIQQPSACPTCGETITRQFCPACGEEKFDRHSFSFRHFAHHAAHELFHLDSKVLRGDTDQLVNEQQSKRRAAGAIMRTCPETHPQKMHQWTTDVKTFSAGSSPIPRRSA